MALLLPLPFALLPDSLQRRMLLVLEGAEQQGWELQNELCEAARNGF